MSGILDRSPCFIADFRPQTVNGLLQCPNLGQAAGAPRYCVLGDGSTAGTIPVPNASGRFGASFTGTQYVNTGIVDRYEWNQQFSLYIYGSAKISDATILSAFNTATSTGWYVRMKSAGGTRVALYSGVGAADFIEGAFQLVPANSYVWTWPGTDAAAGCKGYVGGKNVALSVASDTRSGTVKTGKSILLGTNWNGAGVVATGTSGTIYACGVFDGLLTPSSISELDTLVRSKIASW
jgi:hypothetical protein